MALDPTNDLHWSRGGKPDLGAVMELYGSGAVTRRMIEDAAPGYTRLVALEASP